MACVSLRRDTQAFFWHFSGHLEEEQLSILLEIQSLIWQMTQCPRRLILYPEEIQPKGIIIETGKKWQQKACDWSFMEYMLEKTTITGGRDGQ
jgi:hypothetical protein